MLTAELQPDDYAEIGDVVTVLQETGARPGPGATIRLRRGAHIYEGKVVATHRTSRHLEVRLERQVA